MDSGCSKLLIYDNAPTLSPGWQMLVMSNLDIHALKWGPLWDLRKSPKGRFTWEKIVISFCVHWKTDLWVDWLPGQRPVLSFLRSRSRGPSECRTCWRLCPTSVKQANQCLTWIERGREEASQLTPESSSGCRHSSLSSDVPPVGEISPQSKCHHSWSFLPCVRYHMAAQTIFQRKDFLLISQCFVNTWSLMKRPGKGGLPASLADWDSPSQNLSQVS